MWNGNVACPTTLPMKSGQRHELRVVLALEGECGIHLKTLLLNKKHGNS